ncbi:hypothetical protein GCM10023185_14180 [Hymenobacter saemangeumensis]|uniref:DUF5615 domain-containing protein n=1 Tax=Hymenobacter saemangeumensis TaxID=1084522 RepID=A0ABP8I899_9BACT
MRLLADENLEAPIIRQLRLGGHDVAAVAEISPGIMDEDVLALANQENRLLLTIDKDFGDLIFRHRLPHAGVFLCRIADLPIAERATLILQMLAQHGPELHTGFGVLTGRLFRLTKIPDSV